MRKAFPISQCLGLGLHGDVPVIGIANSPQHAAERAQQRNPQSRWHDQSTPLSPKPRKIRRPSKLVWPKPSLGNFRVLLARLCIRAFRQEHRVDIRAHVVAPDQGSAPQRQALWTIYEPCVYWMRNVAVRDRSNGAIREGAILKELGCCHLKMFIPRS